MHYYPFNIADFGLHTSHLTLEEEAVYRRLLDFYYDTEKPIPRETQPVIRRLRLGSFVAEFEQVLSEFFTLEEDGWHSYRCDIEIKNYHENAERARKNGKKGGRPSKNKGQETQPVILANPDITHSKANQELRTKNQELRTSKLVNPSGVTNLANVFIVKGEQLRFIKALSPLVNSVFDSEAIEDAMERLSIDLDHQPIPVSRAIAYCKGALNTAGVR